MVNFIIKIIIAKFYLIIIMELTLFNVKYLNFKLFKFQILFINLNYYSSMLNFTIMNYNLLESV